MDIHIGPIEVRAELGARNGTDQVDSVERASLAERVLDPHPFRPRTDQRQRRFSVITLPIGKKRFHQLTDTLGSDERPDIKPAAPNRGAFSALDVGEIDDVRHHLDAVSRPRTDSINNQRRQMLAYDKEARRPPNDLAVGATGRPLGQHRRQRRLVLGHDKGGDCPGRAAPPRREHQGGREQHQRRPAADAACVPAPQRTPRHDRTPLHRPRPAQESTSPSIATVERSIVAISQPFHRVDDLIGYRTVAAGKELQYLDIDVPAQRTDRLDLLLNEAPQIHRTLARVPRGNNTDPAHTSARRSRTPGGMSFAAGTPG